MQRPWRLRDHSETGRETETERDTERQGAERQRCWIRGEGVITLEMDPPAPDASAGATQIRRKSLSGGRIRKAALSH